MLRAACAVLLSPTAAEARAPRPPVIVVAFDEFNGDTLRAADGRINAGRYPAFASLAGDATWFPSAHAVHDMTRHALPALMDGRLPRRGVSATAHGHPRNIFTLFGRHGYRLRVKEEITAVCPPSRCGRVPWRIPGWHQRLLTKDRAARFHEFVRSLRRGRPTLWFQHVLLPHHPSTFLPSGRHYRQPSDPLMRESGGVAGFANRFLTRQYRRCRPGSPGGSPAGGRGPAGQ